MNFLSKFGEQQLVIVNDACGFNQSETGKYFEQIIKNIIECAFVLPKLNDFKFPLCRE